MKLPYKIIIVSLLLCIGFLPNSTGANFEPAKTVLYLGNDNPGNYSLLQFAIEHGQHQGQLQTNNGVLIIGCSTGHQNTPLFTRLMAEGHKYQVPFQLIGLLFSEQPVQKQ
jgi:hypothetical protein